MGFRCLFEAAFLVVCTLLLIGCVTTMGRPFDLDAIGRIKVGESTKTDVQAAFGEPSNVSTRRDRDWESWTYSFSTFQSGSPENFIPYVRWFFPHRSQTHHRLVTISFWNDKVLSCIFHEDIDKSQNYVFDTAPSTQRQSGMTPCDQVARQGP